MDKQGIVGVAICVALLIVWYPLMQWLGWLPKRPSPRPIAPVEKTRVAPPPASEEKTAGEKAVPALPVVRPSTQPPAGPPSTASTAAPDVSGPGLKPRPVPLETLLLDGTEHMSVEIDARSGGIVGVRLLEYESDADPAKPYVLGDKRFPLCSLEFRQDGKKIRALGEGRVVRKGRREAVLVRPLPGTPLEIRESWKLSAETPYEVDYSVAVRNTGTEAFRFPPFDVTGGAVALPNPKDKKSGGKFAMFSLGVNVLMQGQKRPVSFAAKKIAKLQEKDLSLLAKTPIEWLALHNKYFLFCLATKGKEVLSGFRMQKLKPDPNDYGVIAASVSMAGQRLEPGATFEFNIPVYAGPKELERLRAWQPGLDSVMGLDRFFFWHPAWMGWVSRLILRSLNWLNQVFDTKWGYGWAIIVVTFVIKMLFWPLTHRSTVSMRRMQKIQPLMKEIREKYKADPQKMNRKLMELYREHNVSPLGGCLPIFFQIPVFFALFNVLRGAIELRHASFLWARDLSIPDDLPFSLAGFPIRPFAILMVLTMLLQQKLMPTSPDPSQTRMMLFMTVFMAFIFYGMPSGLTLYWTFNQVLTIGQALVAKRLEERGTGAAAVA
ncbi:MAG: membrane protein insertase YidC [Kiritimatiellaeota bacterium]|nr:membrane protein insertase YidC [Kiritimatiellota bacterium]